MGGPMTKQEPTKIKCDKCGKTNGQKYFNVYWDKDKNGYLLCNKCAENVKSQPLPQQDSECTNHIPSEDGSRCLNCNEQLPQPPIRIKELKVKDYNKEDDCVLHGGIFEPQSPIKDWKLISKELWERFQTDIETFDQDGAAKWIVTLIDASYKRGYEKGAFEQLKVSQQYYDEKIKQLNQTHREEIK
jgi:hypothetical protein